MQRGGESPPLVGMEYRIVRLGGNQAFTLVRRVRFPYAILWQCLPFICNS